MVSTFSIIAASVVAVLVVTMAIILIATTVQVFVLVLRDLRLQARERRDARRKKARQVRSR